MHKILVVLEEPEAAPSTVEAALNLAKTLSADLHLFKAAFDPVNEELNKYLPLDSFEQIKALVVANDRQWVEQLLRDTSCGDVNVTFQVAWCHRQHEGVVEEAAAKRCDLIVKSARLHQRWKEIFHTPDDWHLMRAAACPVILLREQQPEAPKPIIVAGINALDEDEKHRSLHARVISQAANMAKGLEAQLHIVNSVPRVRYIPPHEAYSKSMDVEKIQTTMSQRVQLAIEELLRLEEVHADKLVVTTGRAETVLVEYCDKEQAKMLVIGTVANKGLAGVLLGNTAERILHRIQRSIMIVH